MKRRCEHWRQRFYPIYVIFWLIYRHYKIKYCTDIPASLEIGEGFKIRHLGNIVINPYVKIGTNVDILNGVLLGQEDRGDNKGNPVIGNDVFIGTNAVVVGKVKIGNDVMIAPGAFVNFDVPDHTVVIGNPGKMIKREYATLGYIINRYERPGDGI